MLVVLLALFAAVYAGIIGWFSVKEDTFLYFPRQELRDVGEFDFPIETVALRTRDSVRLVGWVIPAPATPAEAADSSAFWFLYFHGNAGNISSRGNTIHYRNFRGMGVHTFAIDYRGFGLSEGSPSEQGLYEDGRAAFEYLVRQRNIPPHRIVIFGYSLGSAVAVHLASEVEAGGVVLQGAFTSAADVGKELYPFLPVDWLLRSRFDSMSRIHAVDEPKLFLHAVDDEVIDMQFGRQLFTAARQPKSLVETVGGHNRAHREDSARFYGSIEQFIRSLPTTHH